MGLKGGEGGGCDCRWQWVSALKWRVGESNHRRAFRGCFGARDAPRLSCRHHETGLLFGASSDVPRLEDLRGGNALEYVFCPGAQELDVGDFGETHEGHPWLAKTHARPLQFR